MGDDLAELERELDNLIADVEDFERTSGRFMTGETRALALLARLMKRIITLIKETRGNEVSE